MSTSSHVDTLPTPELNAAPLIDVMLLEARFRGLAWQSPQPDLKIWPDKRGRYERVTQVMAAAQRSGVEHIGRAPTAP